ncbi:unnamed protein product [Choristocarpus tenellus]
MRGMEAVAPSFKKPSIFGIARCMVWTIFAERFLESTLTGMAKSGRVDPAQQLGAVPLVRDLSNTRWVETQVLMKGIHNGLNTVYLHSEQSPTPEMFSKVCLTEMCTSESNGSGEEESGHNGKENTFIFEEFAAPAFAHLKGLHGISSETFCSSFREGSSFIELTPNSKSRQRFLFTEDGKYMLKSASEDELESLLCFLPEFAEHFAHNRGSLISRCYGAYRITDSRTNRSTIYMVFSNVFSTSRWVEERYDLKGSTIGRRASQTHSEKPTGMMKDLDLEDISGDVNRAQRQLKGLHLGAGEKQSLMMALRADTEFLCRLKIMDYSLLV